VETFIYIASFSLNSCHSICVVQCFIAGCFFAHPLLFLAFLDSVSWYTILNPFSVSLYVALLFWKLW